MGDTERNSVSDKNTLKDLRDDSEYGVSFSDLRSVNGNKMEFVVPGEFLC